MFQKYKLIYSLFLLCCINTSHLHANELDDIIQNMPDNSWAQINQNQFSSVWTPLAQRPTSWSPGSNITGYSGAAWGDGKLWFFGGNIGQEYGNEVYAFDTLTLRWERMSLPSQTQGTGSSEADAYPVDGLENAPRSGESWDNLAYLNNLNKFAVIDTSFNGSGFDTGPYIFDPVKADPNKVGGTDGSQVNPTEFFDVMGGEMWENRGFSRSSHPVGATSAYASINGEDVVFYSNGGRNYDLWKWIVSPLGAHDDRWVQIGQRNGNEVSYILPGSGTFAPTRNIFIRKSEKKLIYWDVDVGGIADVVTPVVTGSDSFPSDETWGIDYDDSNDVFYLWNGRRKIWKLEPPAVLGSGDWVASLIRPPGEAPNATDQPGVYGKWYYMAEYGAFIGAADGDGNVFVYKPEPNVPLPPPPPPPPPTGDEIDFSQSIVGAYDAGQDIEGTFSIEDDGATLAITGNSWKQIAFNYDITVDTVLEFDFASENQGEVHAIGLDNDLLKSRDNVFQLYGTQIWGNQNANIYAGSGAPQRFTIPIGQYYTGSMKYLFFIMDDDTTNPDGHSVFSNVNLYEPDAEPTAPVITSLPALQAISNVAYNYDDDGYIDATGTGPITFSLVSGPEGLSIGENGSLAWTPTAIQEGEQYIEVIAENEHGSDIQSFLVTVLAGTQGDTIDFNQVFVDSYEFEQDVDGTATIDNDGQGIELEGNTWKQINFDYTITSETILEFDFSSTSEGEVHAIGFDDDLFKSRTNVFQLYGTQTWGNQSDNTYNGSGTSKRYVIPVGQFYTGHMQYLFFIMDDDTANPDAISSFRNIKVYDEPAELLPPLFTSAPSTRAVIDEAYYYDIDGFVEASGVAPVTFSLIDGPEGMSVSADGFVSWTPNSSQEGEHYVEIQAQDSVGSAIQTFNVVVGLPIEAIDFNQHNIDSYELAQDIEGSATVLGDGEALELVGNTWKQIGFDYMITQDTVLEFDFSSDSQGEVHGIGLDNDTVKSKDFVFQIYGTQTWGNQGNNSYSGNGNSQRFVIPIGQYYTGTMQHMFFIMDDDVPNPDGKSIFSNVKVYESK